MESIQLLREVCGLLVAIRQLVREFKTKLPVSGRMPVTPG
jgi:hypothetical protein